MRTQRLVVAVSLLGLLLGACGKANHAPGVATAGGGSKTGSRTGASPSPVDREEARRKYAQCMRDHGVAMSDPVAGSGAKVDDLNVDKKTLIAAADACKALAVGEGAPTTLSPQQLEQARKLAQCMRDHGIDVPDPDPDTGVARIFTSGNIDFDSQAFKDAMTACHGLQPTLPPGGTK